MCPVAVMGIASAKCILHVSCWWHTEHAHTVRGQCCCYVALTPHPSPHFQGCRSHTLPEVCSCHLWPHSSGTFHQGYRCHGYTHTHLQDYHLHTRMQHRTELSINTPIDQFPNQICVAMQQLHLLSPSQLPPPPQLMSTCGARFICGYVPFLMILILSLRAEVVPIAQQEPQSAVNRQFSLHSRLCVEFDHRFL